MLMAVCVGFWVISATVSAGIGAVMRLAGRQLKHTAAQDCSEVALSHSPGPVPHNWPLSSRLIDVDSMHSLHLHVG
jgi:hypothetical protein